MPPRKLQKCESLIRNVQLKRLVNVQEKQLFSLVKQLFHWTCWMQVDHKQFLDEVFFISRLMKVEVGVIRRSRRPRGGGGGALPYETDGKVGNFEFNS